MLPVASVWPSGEKATDQTSLRCPRSAASWVLLARSHSLTSWSVLAVESRVVRVVRVEAVDLALILLTVACYSALGLAAAAAIPAVPVV
jgi:hypothetical protein